MLPNSPQLPKSYGHNHIKKFWLMQTISENESLDLLSPSMLRVFNSSSHANDSKQLGTTSNTCMSPSTLPIKPIVTRAPPFCGSVFPCNPRGGWLACAGSFDLNSDRHNSLNFTAYGHDTAGNGVPNSGRPLKPAVCRSSMGRFPRKKFKCLDLNSDFRARSLLTEVRPSGFSYFYRRTVSHAPVDNVDEDASSYDNAFPAGRLEANSSVEELFGGENHNLDRTKNEMFEGSHADNNKLEACNDEKFHINNCFLSAADLCQIASKKSSPESAIGLLYLSLAAGKASGDVCIENLHCPDNSEQNSNQELKTCSICGTSKTPLWRSGPGGPKSLCNACGIRFKKSKRWNSLSENVDFSVSPQNCPDSKCKTLRGLKRKQESTEESSQDMRSESFAGCVISRARKTRSLRINKRGHWITNNKWNYENYENSCKPAAEHLINQDHSEHLINQDNSVIVVGITDREAANILMCLSSA